MKNKYDIKLIGFLPPPYGGVSIYILRLYERLKKEGLKIGTFYKKEGQSTDYKSDLLDEFRWLSTRKFLTTYLYYARIVKNYEVIHSHMSLEAMPYLWAFKTFMRKKVIVTIHNSMISNYYKYDPNFINKFFLRLMAKSDVTWIAVSEAGKEGMLQLPFKFKNEIFVIPAYIPIKKENGSPLPTGLCKYASLHKKNMVFYGHSFMLDNGVDIYGFESAVNAYSSIVENEEDKVGLIFCIADDSDREKIELLHQKAIEAGVDERIYWQIGPIRDMDALWRLTDLYIRPTSTDGDSVAVREALDLGVHVVASDVCVRPHGVDTYRYGDMQDFILCIRNNLAKPKGAEKSNWEPYKMMLNVYQQILKTK